MSLLLLSLQDGQTGEERAQQEYATYYEETDAILAPLHAKLMGESSLARAAGEASLVLHWLVDGAVGVGGGAVDDAGGGREAAAALQGSQVHGQMGLVVRGKRKANADVVVNKAGLDAGPGVSNLILNPGGESGNIEFLVSDTSILIFSLRRGRSINAGGKGEGDASSRKHTQRIDVLENACCQDSAATKNR